MSKQKEFGDFQTPLDLAGRVVRLAQQLFGRPAIVVEPTAGWGTFLRAAHDQWGTHSEYQGFEINGAYVQQANENLADVGIHIREQDFFSADWRSLLGQNQRGPLLVLGNLPWVTNSELGVFQSSNLPQKSNFQRHKGFDAKTGKANFDIAEWMLIRLLEALPVNAALAMLCKTATARKVLKYFWNAGDSPATPSLFTIDAKQEFNVAVDACLFYAGGRRTSDKTAMLYSDLDTHSSASKFGFCDGQLVSNLDDYQELRELDGGSPYTWRSGIKHDAAAVMEFTVTNGDLVNGFGEIVDIESQYVYPLLKSSDLGNGRVEPRKALLVTQHAMNEETALIEFEAPKTWQYLLRFAAELDQRKSSIYVGRQRFCIFGVGDYSFMPWKVAISGLYKSLTFSVVPPIHGRPVMVDDTCYAVGCESEEEATLLSELLNSVPAQRFLAALVFLDSKRPMTMDVLKRLSLKGIARFLGREAELAPYFHNQPSHSRGGVQKSLFI